MVLNAAFSETSQELRATFDTSSQEFEIKLQDYIKGVDAGELYDGVYEVTPKSDYPQELPTASKTLLKNIKVLKVPTYTVDNMYGGQTITIGV